MFKYRFYILGFVLLGIVAVFLHKCRTGNSFGSREASFAVENYDQINMISITSHDSQISLQRKNGYWLLDSGHDARENAVEMLLRTFGRLRVNSPVPNSLLEKVNHKLQSEAIRIDIKIGRKSRRYYVWSEGPGHPAYMLRHGSSNPYVVEVLGYSGNVAGLFVAEEGYWRTNILFNYRPDEIEEVLVQYRDNEEDSFILRQSPAGEFTIKNHADGDNVMRIEDSLAIRYLANFIYVPYERMAGREERMMIDSLLIAGYDYHISVGAREGNATEVWLYRILLNGDGDQVFDLFRLYALINEGEELVIIPYHEVDLLLRRYSYFTGGPKDPGQERN
jgi:hypothetical protein